MRQVSVSNGGFAGCSACRLNQLGSLVASSGPCFQQYTSAVCTNFEWIYYSTLMRICNISANCVLRAAAAGDGMWNLLMG